MKSPKKRLIPFRLFESDIEKWKMKSVADLTSMQKVFEVLVKMYLESDETVMKRVKSVSKEKFANRRRYTGEFDELERSLLYHKIEQMSESKLSETQQILEEIDKENK